MRRATCMGAKICESHTGGISTRVQESRVNPQVRSAPISVVSHCQQHNRASGATSCGAKGPKVYVEPRHLHGRRLLCGGSVVPPSTQ